MENIYINKVKIYSILATYNIITKSELVYWIDKQIANIDEPPDVFIDAAFLTNGSLKNILKVFDDYLWCKDIENDKVMQGIVDVFNTKYLEGQISCRKGIEILSNIILEIDDCEGNFEDILDLDNRLLFLDDDLEYFKSEGYSEEELKIEEDFKMKDIKAEFEETIGLYIKK